MLSIIILNCFVIMKMLSFREVNEDNMVIRNIFSEFTDDSNTIVSNLDLVFCSYGNET